MSRCQCCDRLLIRTTGKRKLEDGSLVEETFCNICKHEVTKCLLDLEYNKDYKFEGILEQQLLHGCVTPQKNPKY